MPEQATISDQIATGQEFLECEIDDSTGSFQADEEIRDRWRAVVDRPLIDWGKNPEAFEDEDEDFEPPSREIISFAAEFARNLGNRSCSPPLRVVMNGEGGITFEWRDGNEFSTLEISKDGRGEFCLFQDCCLIERGRLF